MCVSDFAGPIKFEAGDLMLESNSYFSVWCGIISYSASRDSLFCHLGRMQRPLATSSNHIFQLKTKKEIRIRTSRKARNQNFVTQHKIDVINLSWRRINIVSMVFLLHSRSSQGFGTREIHGVGYYKLVGRRYHARCTDTTECWGGKGHVRG